MKNSIYVLSFSAMVALGSCNNKASNTGDDSATDGKESRLEKTETKRDSEFAVEATNAGLLEVKMSELAQNNGSATEIKELAQVMIDDQGRGNAELAGLAENKNISVPDNLSEKDQKRYDKLAELKGSDFDKAYAELMVVDHQDDIEEFTREAEGGYDADIKMWAARNVSTLEHHLELAENAKHVVNGGKGE